MTHSSFLSLGLVTLVALSGCSGLDRSSDSRWDPDRHDRRADSRRADSRRSDNRSVDQDRVRRDARVYAETLDRALQLDSRDERRVRAILEDRADGLSRRGRIDRDAYPFPRPTAPHRAQPLRQPGGDGLLGRRGPPD